MRSSIQLVIFGLTCIGTLFATSTNFIDSQLMPKWFVLLSGFLLISTFSIIIYIINPNKTNSSKYIKQKNTSIIIIGTIFFQAIYGILQYMNIISPTSIFQVSGSFNNPAGFAASLCAGIPYCILGIINAKGILRWTIKIAFISIILAIILSESRTGILSMTIVLSCWCFKRTQLSSLAKKIIFPIILIGIIIGLYYYKKDSADGRLLIWKCSIPMLKENLFAGGGSGTFEAKYMDYQAKYFEQSPDSIYSKLAGNVQYPFCEYLQLITDYGLIGILLLLIWISLLLFSYLKHPSVTSEIALLCYISVCVFSCFSYPLMYPFVWLMLIYSTHLLIWQYFEKISTSISTLRLKMAITFCLVPIFYIGSKTFFRMQAEIEWKQIANLSSIGRTEKVLPKYQKIKNILKNDRYFLFNYSAELFQAKLYTKSLIIATECRKLWADYDLEILLGDIQYQLSCFDKAEVHYKQASLMCPNRFLPLYKLYTLYKKTLLDT